jgi:uroporphyrinogen-III synthase
MKLVDKRILITRSRAQADEFASALIAEGAKPVFFPVIEIIPPDDFFDFDGALKKLDEYDWIIFTSVHGVEAFFRRLDFLGIQKIPSHTLVIAVGSKTAQVLNGHGVSPNHVPDEYVAEKIFSEMDENIAWKRFLLPQSDLARKTLSHEIRFAGGVVDEVIAYRTVATQPDPSGLEALRSGVDIITFTSPSTVKNFIHIVRENGLDPFNLPGQPLFACIGPVTQKAAQEIGLTNLITANQYTTDGLVQVLGNLVRS